MPSVIDDTGGAGLTASKGSIMAEPKGQKTESDVEPETHESRSRAGEGEDDGTYVGRTDPDDALDVGESGAEARSTRK